MYATFSSFHESDALETDVNCFYELLYEQLDRTAPRRGRKPREGSNWWTPELSSMREELKRLLTHKKNPIMAEKLGIVRRGYSSIIRRERSNSWRSFFTKAEAAKEINTLVPIVGNDKIRGVSRLRQGNTFAILAKESLDFLLKQHFPLHLPLREEEQSKEEMGKYMSSYRSEKILQYFQVWRVKAATASFQPMKAAGPDDLIPVVLQHIGDEALAKIKNFFKRSMVSSFIPKRWCQMKVVFIPTLGKDDYSVPKAYRPITISNFLLEVMERVINWFLSERINSLPLRNQHAYTRGIGIETTLSSFADLVESAFHRGKKSLVVSLDCSGAFDRIKFSSAKEALDSAGLPAIVAGWYNQVLTGRL